MGTVALWLKRKGLSAEVAESEEKQGRRAVSVGNGQGLRLRRGKLKA